MVLSPRAPVCWAWERAAWGWSGGVCALLPLLSCPPVLAFQTGGYFVAHLRAAFNLPKIRCAILDVAVCERDVCLKLK